MVKTPSLVHRTHSTAGRGALEWAHRSPCLPYLLQHRFPTGTSRLCDEKQINPPIRARMGWAGGHFLVRFVATDASPRIGSRPLILCRPSARRGGVTTSGSCLHESAITVCQQPNTTLKRGLIVRSQLQCRLLRNTVHTTRGWRTYFTAHAAHPLLSPSVLGSYRSLKQSRGNPHFILFCSVLIV